MATNNFLLRMIGNSNGNYSNKYNRAQKLINNWDVIKAKVERYVIKGKGKTILSKRAWLVLLMMETGIRIGNTASANGYVSKNKFGKHFNKIVKTFGAITLQVKHCKLSKDGQSLRISFLGKKQVQINTSTNNPIIIKYFPVMVSGKEPNDLVFETKARFINGFIIKRIGHYFTAKDLRTAIVNLIYIDNAKFPASIKNKREAKLIMKLALEKAAEFAGHTPGVCKSKYVSPDMLWGYQESLFSLI